MQQEHGIRLRQVDALAAISASVTFSEEVVVHGELVEP